MKLPEEPGGDEPRRDVPLLYVIAARDLFSEENAWLEKIHQVVHAAKCALVAGHFAAGSVAIQIRPALSHPRKKASDRHPLQLVEELLSGIDPSRQIPVYYNMRSGLPGAWKLPRQPLRLHLTEGHLRGADLPDKAVTWAASAHNKSAVCKAQEGGAAFAVYGPVWEPQWKAALAIGVEAFAAAAAATRIPLLALGGITSARVAACREAGAAGVAVASGFMLSDDVAQTLQDFMEPLQL